VATSNKGEFLAVTFYYGQYHQEKVNYHQKKYNDYMMKERKEMSKQ